MTYDIGDAHLNPNIYSEPEVFDPNRFAAPREEGKNTYGAFLGWGAGRHPCAGELLQYLEESRPRTKYMVWTARYKSRQVGNQDDSCFDACRLRIHYR